MMIWNTFEKASQPPELHVLLHPWRTCKMKNNQCVYRERYNSEIVKTTRRLKWKKATAKIWTLVKCCWNNCTMSIMGDGGSGNETANSLVSKLDQSWTFSMFLLFILVNRKKKDRQQFISIHTHTNPLINVTTPLTFKINSCKKKEL